MCFSQKSTLYFTDSYTSSWELYFFFLAKSAFSDHPKTWELLCSSCCLVYTFWIWDIQKQIQSNEIKIGRRTWIKITIHIILFQIPIVCHLIPWTYFNQTRKMNTDSRISGRQWIMGRTHCPFMWPSTSSPTIVLRHSEVMVIISTFLNFFYNVGNLNACDQLQ